MNEIIYFGAKWCAPCKTMKVVLNDIIEKTGVKVTFHDVEEAVELSQMYGVRSVPALFREDSMGNILDNITGMKTKQELLDFIGVSLDD